jgi:hypothetical protein
MDRRRFDLSDGERANLARRHSESYFSDASGYAAAAAFWGIGIGAPIAAGVTLLVPWFSFWVWMLLIWAMPTGILIAVSIRSYWEAAAARFEYEHIEEALRRAVED